jgi:hypothetical protein
MKQIIRSKTLVTRDRTVPDKVMAGDTLKFRTRRSSE